MKIRAEYVSGTTFVHAGGCTGMAVRSRHDVWSYAMGLAVALLKSRPRSNRAMRDRAQSIVNVFPNKDVALSLMLVEEVILTDSEVMSYCMIRAELTNRIKDASKVEEKFDWDDGGEFLLGTRRRRGPDNAFIVEDCARKLVKACPSIARLDDA